MNRGRVHLCLLCLFVTILSVGCARIRYFGTGRTVSSERFQTCRLCKSSRKIVERNWSSSRPPKKMIVIRTKETGFSTCKHQWEDGIAVDASDAPSDGGPVGRPITDDTVVLVRQGDAFGAFILRDQRIPPGMGTGMPDMCSYEWYYRTDGKGRFGDRSPQILKGTAEVKNYGGTPTVRLKFGPFSVEWSAAETGKGFIYYSCPSREQLPPDGLRICVTRETDISRVDATSGKWIYRGCADDDGVRGNERIGN